MKPLYDGVNMAALRPVCHATWIFFVMLGTAGCAGSVQTEVMSWPQASCGSTIPSDTVHTIAFQHENSTPAGTYQAVENEVAAQLSGYGLQIVPPASANYRVALSYASRPASMEIDAMCDARTAPDCTGDTHSLKTAHTVFGALRYVHTFTMRITDASDGRTACRITARRIDTDPAGRHASDVVKAAFTRFMPAGETMRHTHAAHLPAPD